jgi:hypothetical protein
MAVRPKYSDNGTAMNAIGENVLDHSPLQNVPTSNITAGDFRNMWMTKWNGGSGTWAGQPPDYDVQIAKRDLGKILDRIETVNKPKAA